MRWLRTLALLLLAALVQTTLVPALEVRGARPDLLLIATVWLVARVPTDRRAAWTAFWTGWLAGLLADVYSAGSHLPFGTLALTFGLGAVAVCRLGADLFLGSALAQGLVIGAVALLVHIALAFALHLAAGGPLHVLVAQALGAALYSAFLAPVLFAVPNIIARVLRPRARRSARRA